jgi:hypothetical protein
VEATADGAGTWMARAASAAAARVPRTRRLFCKWSSSVLAPTSSVCSPSSRMVWISCPEKSSSEKTCAWVEEKAVDAPDARVPADMEVSIVAVDPASEAESALTDPASEAREWPSSLPEGGRLSARGGTGGGGICEDAREADCGGCNAAGAVGPLAGCMGIFPAAFSERGSLLPEPLIACSSTALRRAYGPFSDACERATGAGTQPRHC